MSKHAANRFFLLCQENVAKEQRGEDRTVHTFTYMEFGRNSVDIVISLIGIDAFFWLTSHSWPLRSSLVHQAPCILCTGKSR